MKMPIINHTSNRTYLDLLPINIVYFILENRHFVLEMSWKIIFPLAKGTTSTTVRLPT